MPSPKAPPEQGGGARWRIDRAQKSLLEEAFSAKRFPSPETKRRLADQLHVDVRRIQVWFQNRRQRLSAKEGGGGEQSSPPHELFDAMDAGTTLPSNLPGNKYGSMPATSYLEPWIMPEEAPAQTRSHYRVAGDGSPKKRPRSSKESGNNSTQGIGQQAHQKFQTGNAPGSGYPLSEIALMSRGGKKTALPPTMLADSTDIVHALMGFDQAPSPPPCPKSHYQRCSRPSLPPRPRPQSTVDNANEYLLDESELWGSQPSRLPMHNALSSLRSGCLPRAWKLYYGRHSSGFAPGVGQRTLFISQGAAWSSHWHSEAGA